MGRSQETFNKKNVRNKQEKKRKDKEKKRLARKEQEKSGSLDDMIAYVDENGNLTSTPPDPSKKEKVNIEDIEISVPKREAQEDDPVKHGTVSFFNEDKGFGFIRIKDSKESVFVHAKNLIDPIKEGNLVNFEIENGPKGPAATNVKLTK